jgi:DNA-directed RNA polymerase subunit K/omega
VKPRHAKPTRIAMDEIAANVVKWQLEAPVEEPTAISE